MTEDEKPNRIRLRSLGGQRSPELKLSSEWKFSPEIEKLLEDISFNVAGSSSVGSSVTSSPTFTISTRNAFGDPTLNERLKELEDTTTDLRRKVTEQTQVLKQEQTSGKEKEKRIATLTQTLEQLQAKEKLGFLLSRVGDAAVSKLLESQEFQRQFLETRECEAVVMAVDIRRSTDLMLKARTPEAFADFITALCRELMAIVIESMGVFDKFTGDGVLAFYPEFYSGPDAIFRAVAAADDCHAAFRRHYHKARRSFTSILNDVGLGIGIDCGKVHLVQVAGGLTVVGGPVVYACRLSGAPSHLTFANQPAFEILAERTNGSFLVTERELDIKHEGKMLAYDVRLNSRDYVPETPGWMQRTGEDATRADPVPDAPTVPAKPPAQADEGKQSKK